MGRWARPSFARFRNNRHPSTIQTRQDRACFLAGFSPADTTSLRPSTPSSMMRSQLNRLLAEPNPPARPVKPIERTIIGAVRVRHCKWAWGSPSMVPTDALRAPTIPLSHLFGSPSAQLRPFHPLRSGGGALIDTDAPTPDIERPLQTGALRALSSPSPQAVAAFGLVGLGFASQIPSSHSHLMGLAWNHPIRCRDKR